jgi:nicotinamidase/pyrazinamidase
MTIGKDAALLLVDIQNDFCSGGALPVPDGDKVVVPLNLLASCFEAAGMAVVASRDWHPEATCHFMEFGGAWPPHCVQGSPGAAFHPVLRLPDATVIISKGISPDSDSYSVFDGRSEDGMSLDENLSLLNIRKLYVGGLATDYCVRSSVLDALSAGYEVTVLVDAIAGVDINQGDSVKALEEMRLAGASFCTTGEAVRQVCSEV